MRNAGTKVSASDYRELSFVKEALYLPSTILLLKFVIKHRDRIIRPKPTMFHVSWKQFHPVSPSLHVLLAYLLPDIFTKFGEARPV